MGTALEALIIELLGDVGRLHDEVKAVNAAVPAATDAFREAADEIVRSMTDQSEKAVKNVQAAAQDEIRAMRRVAALLVVAALVGGLAGGAAVMYWLGQH